MASHKERQKRRGKAETAAAVAPAVLPQTSTPAWLKHALIILALWTCALIAYSNSFNGAFVFDNSIILQDSRIKAFTPENVDLILTQEYWYQTAMTGLYRPLTTFTYLLNYTLLGDGSQPPGYHWINLGLHAINIALVYCLGLVLLGGIPRAVAMAALWALHPLLTESVTNIVGRADLVSAFGVLGGLLCHIRASSAAGWRKAAWLIGLAVLAAIGFAGKESGVVLLAVIVFYDLAYDGIRLWRTRAASYVALGIPLVSYLYYRHQVLSKILGGVIAYTDNPLYDAGFWTARFTAVKVIGKYLWLLLLPATLSSDYSYNQIPLVGWRLDWEDLKAWIALAVCLAAVGVAIWSYRRQRAVFFFILFFFVTLAPTANIFLFIGTIMAERFMYLPAIAYCGCLVIALWWICGRLPAQWRDARVPAGIAAVAALAFLGRTYARNNDWLTEEGFWAKAVETSPNSFKPHMAYATSILAPNVEQQVDRSISEIEKALAIVKPLADYQQPSALYINAGLFYRAKGMLTKSKFSDAAEGERQARVWYQKSLQMLQRDQRIEAAITGDAKRQSAGHAVEVKNAGWWQLNLELGRTYLSLKQPDQAIDTLEAGLRRRPAPDFYTEIAAAWRQKGDLRRAAVTLMEALMVDPTHSAFTSGLVEIYKQLDPQSCAVQQRGGATSVNLACPMVHEDLCAGAHDAAVFYLQVGQRPKAAEIANTAIRDFSCSADPFK